VAGVAEGALDGGTALLKAAPKLSGVGWYEAVRHLLGLPVIEIIHGRDAGGMAEASEAIVEVQQVRSVAVVDILPVLGGAAELGTGWVEVGSGVACVDIKKMYTGNKFANLIAYFVALAAGSTVDECAQVR